MSEGVRTILFTKVELDGLIGSLRLPITVEILPSEAAKQPSVVRGASGVSSLSESGALARSKGAIGSFEDHGRRVASSERQRERSERNPQTRVGREGR